jgi:hypothetical protein
MSNNYDGAAPAFPSVAVRVQSHTVVEIVMHPSLTTKELQSCLVQVLSVGSSTQLADDQIFGLYRESDGKFLPLTQILLEPETISDDVLCLANPCTPTIGEKEKEEGKGPDKLHKAIKIVKSLWDLAVDQPMVSFACLPIAMAIAYYFVALLQFATILVSRIICRQAMNCSSLLWECMIFFHTLLVDTPIKEVYRYGPPIIGWEGISLAKVCAKSTHYGDEDFWDKNSVECKDIYLTKEHAALILFRPVVYLVAAALAYFLRRIFFAGRKKKPALDPNMVETFQALNSLVRQLHRSFVSASK